MRFDRKFYANYSNPIIKAFLPTVLLFTFDSLGAGWDSSTLNSWRSLTTSAHCVAITASNPSGYIYAVGYSAGGQNAYIYRYNGSTWTELVNSAIDVTGRGGAAIGAIAQSGNYLYLVGQFSYVGPGNSVAANSVARFNLTTSQWSAIGSGITHTAGSPTVTVVVPANNGTGNNWVYVGGIFDRAGGIAVNNLARFNTDTLAWADVGGGVLKLGDAGTWSYPVNTMYVQLLWTGSGYVHEVFVGGYFSKIIGSQTAYNLAKWTDGYNTWTRFGPGYLSCGDPQPLQNYHNFISKLAKKPNGTFLIAGSFDTVDGDTSACASGYGTDLATMPSGGGIGSRAGEMSGPPAGVVSVSNSEFYLHSGPGNQPISSTIYLNTSPQVSGNILRSLNGVWSTLPDPDPSCGGSCGFKHAVYSTSPAGVFFGGDLGVVRWNP